MTSTDTTPIQVDVAQVLRSKNPALARYIPGFLVRYLRRIVHENEVNYVLTHFAHLDPIRFIRSTLDYMQITYRAEGLERLDPQGRYLFASNHPFGGMDGMMLATEVSSYFGDVRVIVNDLLMNLRPLAPIFVPVNKHGRQNSSYAETIRQTFDSNIPIITFPAGLCSRRHQGIVCDLEWKPNFVKKAIESQRAIVPVHFDGHLSNFFYRLSNLRTALGIKANIEMLYLADEMFAQRGRHFDIRIGAPIPWQDLADQTSARVWANRIKELSYAMKK